MRRIAALGLLCALAALVVLAQVNIGGGTPGAGSVSGGPAFWNGTAAPSSIVGANGDFYLNTTTTCLYGPKATGAWPASCVSLIGQAGAPGAPLGYVAENSANRGTANGYAPLDSSALLPAALLPTSAITNTTLGNGSLPASFTGVSTTSVGAGAFMMTAGAAQNPPANTVGLQAPLAVPSSFNCTWWGVPAAGLVHATGTIPCILNPSLIVPADLDPSFPAVATSGSYNDLLNKPTMPSSLLLSPPPGFPWQNPPIQINSDLTTNFDSSLLAPTGKTYYVNGATGSDSNTGTLAAPLKSLYGCYSGKADSAVCMVAPGWYHETANATTQSNFTHDISIIASAPGVYVSRSIQGPAGPHDGSGLVWTNSGSGYWSAPYTPQYTVTGALDTSSIINSYGDFAFINPQTSPSLVGSTAGSWYFASNTIYVHTFDSRPPDANVQFYEMNYRAIDAETANSYTVYLQGLTLVGGYASVLGVIGNSLTQRAVMIVNNCHITSNPTGDVLGVNGWTTLILQNSYIGNANGDAISYGTCGDLNHYCFSLEVNVVAGNTNPAAGPAGATNDNGSTTHGNDAVIRLNSTYLNTFGPLLADTTGAQIWNLGTISGPSLAATNNSNYLASGFGVSGIPTNVWIDRGVSILPTPLSGATDLTTNAGGVIYVHSMIPAVPTGGARPTYEPYYFAPGGGTYAVGSGPAPNYGIAQAVNPCISASASGTAYTCTSNPPLNTCTTGMTVPWVPDVANSSGSITLNVGCAVKPVLTSSSTSPVVSLLSPGVQVLIWFDGTNWRLPAIVPGSSGATATAPISGVFGVGASNPYVSGASAATSASLNIASLGLTTSTLGSILWSCSSGTGYAGTPPNGYPTGPWTPLPLTTTTMTPSTTTASFAFASATNWICGVNSNGGVGAAGPAGPTGAAGAGSAGPPGTNGTNGVNGTNGQTIWNGPGAPSSGTGTNGDFYLNIANSCLYGPKASGVWPGACTSLIGATLAFPNAAMHGSFLGLGVGNSSVGNQIYYPFANSGSLTVACSGPATSWWMTPTSGYLRNVTANVNAAVGNTAIHFNVAPGCTSPLGVFEVPHGGLTIPPASPQGGYLNTFAPDIAHLHQWAPLAMGWDRQGGSSLAVIASEGVAFVSDDGTDDSILGSVVASALTASSTQYFGFSGAGLNATEGSIAIPIPFSGTLSNLMFSNSISPTNAVTVTVNKDGANSGISGTIAAADPANGYYSDTTHTTPVVAGDYIDIQTVSGAGTQAILQAVTLLYVPSDGVSALLYGIYNGAASTTPRWGIPFGILNSATEPIAEYTSPLACTATNLYVYQSVANGAGITTTATLYQNGIAAALSGTIAPAVPGSVAVDTTHSVPIAAGDRLSIQFKTNNTSGGMIGGWSIRCN